MWQGFETALAAYGGAICREWIDRGYRDSLLPFFEEYAPTSLGFLLPEWMGDPAFHASHRSNLIRKDPIWYGQFGWTEPDDLPYVWPRSSKHVDDRP
jgi:hypothetical protein